MVKRILHITTAVFLAILLSLILCEIGVNIYSRIAGMITSKEGARSDKIRFYILGGSTAAGEPYTGKVSFSKIVQYMYEGQLIGKVIEIVDLSKHGGDLENSYWNLFNYLHRNPGKPGIVLVYSGINDNCGWPGLRDLSKLKRIRNLILPMKAVRVAGNNKDKNNFYMKISRYFSIDIDSLEKYIFYNQQLIDLAERFKLPVIISTLSGNLSEFAPQSYPIFTKEQDTLFNKAVDLEKNNYIDEAEAIYKELASQTPEYLTDPNNNSNYIYYRIGKCRQKQGDNIQADIYFSKSVEFYDHKRANQYQNDYIRSLSEYPNVKIVDTYKAIRADAGSSFPGYTYFWDAHHPKLNGYIIMAKQFAAALSELYGVLPVIHDPSEEDIIREFEIDHEFLKEVYYGRARWMIKSFFGHEGFKLLEKASEYLDISRELDPLDPEPYLWYFIIERLRKNYIKAEVHAEKGKIFNENSNLITKRPYILELLDIIEMDDKTKIRFRNLFNQ